MTNRELVDAAWAEVLTSTISGAEWQNRVTNGYKGKPYNWQNTAFGRAKLLLDQVTDIVVPTPPAGYAAPAWLVTEQLNQTDPDSGAGNKYTAGWVKSARTAPGYPASWQDNGYLKFSDYPDECVVVCSKQFVAGCPGATTNFHLTGGDEVHNGVSPIRGDWHEGRGVYEVVCQAEGDGSGNNYHWTIAPGSEIDRAAVYTEQWRIRWRTDRTGYIHLTVLKNGQPWKQVNADNIRTQYVEQKPQAFIWIGGYAASGLQAVAKTRVTLDHRGRTLAEALADRPRYGSIMHTVSTVGGPDSSVVADGTLAVA